MIDKAGQLSLGNPENKCRQTADFLNSAATIFHTTFGGRSKQKTFARHSTTQDYMVTNRRPSPFQ
jgi:hypothetical protein